MTLASFRMVLCCNEMRCLSDSLQRISTCGIRNDAMKANNRHVDSSSLLFLSVRLRERCARLPFLAYGCKMFLIAMTNLNTFDAKIRQGFQ